MKYVLWMALGLIGGAVLGLAIPILLTMLIVWQEGENANGIGTPMALLTLLTVPLGALLGTYAGWRRAELRNWSGLFSGTSNPQAMNLLKVMAIKRRFPRFLEETEGMPPDRARFARQDYLWNLWDEYEATTLNVGLVAVWALGGLLMPPLLIVPLVITAKHLLAKKLLRDHLRDVMAQWSQEQLPTVTNTVGQK